ncbi:hypothetical protein O1611_g1562 [Lasiodiplodia mahajangana]|uniref:Uncharacterized protein n=1 Tax=Lasiodiplodia mahajangana TaxID=1108764 RepID=A0ACC2JX94_9PEZI|nr:hypothetical protein O1611_g1562 [Lasiodiplodia mahajangana]
MGISARSGVVQMGILAKTPEVCDNCRATRLGACSVTRAAGCSIWTEPPPVETSVNTGTRPRLLPLPDPLRGSLLVLPPPWKTLAARLVIRLLPAIPRSTTRRKKQAPLVLDMEPVATLRDRLQPRQPNMPSASIPTASTAEMARQAAAGEAHHAS